MNTSCRPSRRRRRLLLLCLSLVIGPGCQRRTSSEEERKTATGVLVRFPSDVRSAEAWRGHSFVVDGVPVQPSAKVTEADLLERVGKRVRVTGRWNPGVVVETGSNEPPTQAPVSPDPGQPMVRGDGIVVETLEDLQSR